jgi:hypothetical protein
MKVAGFEIFLLSGAFFSISMIKPSEMDMAESAARC